ncbi:hypothetical protein MELB17_09903 [Marinobacter sp. ELB17]|nr:hypothetical protein MELB17_09903 [Marinobacter sp. ELB17]
MRCKSVLDCYSMADVSDHRYIGNLCYEARAIIQSIGGSPTTADETVALRKATQMLLVMGFDTSMSRVVLADGNETITNLIAKTCIQPLGNKVVGRVRDSLQADGKWLSVDMVPEWLYEPTTPAAYESYLSDHEVSYLGDEHLGRLLAERLHTKIPSNAQHLIQASSAREKQRAFAELFLFRSHQEVKILKTAHVIYTQDGVIKAITECDDMACMAESEGYIVEANASLAEVLETVNQNDWSVYCDETRRLLELAASDVATKCGETDFTLS